MVAHCVKFMVIGCLVVTGAWCAARPRQTPLKTTPVEQGPNTIDAVRQALQGRWVLVSLNIRAEDGRAASVDATGLLSCDAFGNMSLEYRISENGLKQLEGIGINMPTTVVSTSGNVAIDPQQQRISYVSDDFMKNLFDADLAARKANPFTLERTRYYEMGADGTLTLSTRYDGGTNAAKSLWKKSS
jgi:hypothetical protein